MVDLCKKKAKKIQSGNITFINNSDNKCYITGVPLWGCYYEVQCICTIKISPKLLLKVVVCMQVSRFGLWQLYYSLFKYEESIRKKYFSSKSIFEYLAYLLNIKNSYRAECFNLIIKKSKLGCTDIINKLKNEKYNKLLTSFYQFGCCRNNQYALIVNPNTNDIFVGLSECDITDNLLMNFNKNSDAYVFIIN
jgi:hypothetical protein